MLRGLDIGKEFFLGLGTGWGKPLELEIPLTSKGTRTPEADEVASTESSTASTPVESKAPTSAPSESEYLAPMKKEKDDELDATKKTVDDAASIGGGLWLSYLFVMFYLAVAAGAVTHNDLFLENPVKLPFLNIELPLLAFFSLAPILFVIVHAYALVHLVMLTEKAKRLHRALHDPERNITRSARENLQWQLPSNIFIQFLSGPPDLRESAFGWLLWFIGWITLVIAPILLLLLIQIQFLPFHSTSITWTHRIALALDLVFIWWLWSKILSGKEGNGFSRSWLRHFSWAAALAASAAVVLFAGVVTTFPGEWQEDKLPGWRFLPALVEWEKPATERDATGNPRAASFKDWAVNAQRLTLHDWLFNEQADFVSRRRFPFSSTLVLPGLNIYDGLKIDDPAKAKWRDTLFFSRGRDLNGAIFDFATLPRVDFDSAELRGASFVGAQLQGALLTRTNLQGARLWSAKLQDAHLSNAHLSNASFDAAELQGAVLNFAELQGASLKRTHLQGALLQEAQLQAADLSQAELQGAFLLGAQLQGADLDGAKLQGAVLDYAQLQGGALSRSQLQGASFVGAQLQGALFEGAALKATDFSRAILWRTDGPLQNPSDVASVKLSDKPDRWAPLSREIDRRPWEYDETKLQPWTNVTYKRLRTLLESLAEGNLRDDALLRITRLDCRSSDATLAPCASSNATVVLNTWQQSLNATSVNSVEYQKQLADALKTFFCFDYVDATHVFHGLEISFPSSASRLGATGSDEPALIDFILSKDCFTSAALTDADRAQLLRSKQWIERERTTSEP
jgi:uncharacterized protein YjbI with pentapeptide repeats